MPKKVLGIDIGTSSIKICELGSTLKGFSVVNCYEKGLPLSGAGDSRKEIVTQALRELKEEYSLGGETVVSSIPGQLAALKSLFVPFRDRGKINQIIKFELEPHIPYPIDDVIVDFHITSSSPKGSHIMAWAIPKKVIKEHLSLLEAVNWESATLDLDYLAIVNLFLRVHASPKEKERYALIEIGASKTSIIILEQKNLMFARNIIKGGNFFTELISKNLNLSLNDAEEIKLRGDATIEPSLLQGFTLLQKEIEITFQSFYTIFGRELPVGEIYFTGGGARLKGLLDFFSNALNIKTSLFEPSSHLTYKKPPQSNEAPAPLAVSAGLALRGLNSSPLGINLRKEEFSPQGQGEAEKSKIIFLTVALLILALFFGFDTYQKLQMKEQTYTYLKNQVRKVFTQTLPDVKNIVSEVDQLKAKLKEEQAKAAAFGGSVGVQLSALDLLREVSSRIPKNVRIDLSELIVDQDALRMSGETDSFDAVDNLKKALEMSPYFKEIKITNAKVGTNEKIVEFRISIFLKSGERGGL